LKKALQSNLSTQYMYNVTLRGVRVTIVTVYYITWACVYIAFVIQHEKRMRHIMLLSIACLVLQYFSSLSHKRQDFRGGKNDNKNVF
jgi:hypothetical protein